MKKKIVIVGGGITGCVTALAASKFGFEVELYEKGNDLGGILRDVSCKKNIFYSGCQYFNPHQDWYKIYIENDFETYKFNHKKFSITNFFGKKAFSESVAGVISERFITLKDLNLKFSHNKTLKSRLNIYPRKIFLKIQKWLKDNRFNIEKLSFKSIDGLGLKRVFPMENFSLIKKLKKENKKYDNLIGLSDKYIKSNETTFASLPLDGFNKYFSDFHEILIKNKVKVFLNSIVKPSWKKKELKLIYKSKEIKNDYVYWSGNPTGLIKSYGFSTLDSKYINSKNFFFELSGNIDNEFYIQIYDMNIPVSRIFVYKLKKKLKVTVETISSDIETMDVINYSNKVFKEFFPSQNLKIKNNHDCNKIIKKYVLVTNEDHLLINKFINETKKTNLLKGNWLNYSRDEKINLSIQNLKDINS